MSQAEAGLSTSEDEIIKTTSTLQNLTKDLAQSDSLLLEDDLIIPPHIVPDLSDLSALDETFAGMSRQLADNSRKLWSTGSEEDFDTVASLNKLSSATKTWWGMGRSMQAMHNMVNAAHAGGAISKAIKEVAENGAKLIQAGLELEELVSFTTPDLTEIPGEGNDPITQWNLFEIEADTAFRVLLDENIETGTGVSRGLESAGRVWPGGGDQDRLTGTVTLSPTRDNRGQDSDVEDRAKPLERAPGADDQ